MMGYEYEFVRIETMLALQFPNLSGCSEIGLQEGHVVSCER